MARREPSASSRTTRRAHEDLSVSDRDGLAEFVEVPWTVYRDDPLWVPPLREQVYSELSGGNTSARYGRIRPFLCEADGRIAGRIAASINPRLVDANGAVFGQLGYFECVNEPAIASALIGSRHCASGSWRW